MKQHRHIPPTLLVGFCLTVMAFFFAYSCSADESEASKAVPLDSTCIQRDLMGRSLSGWTFDEGTICRIKILDAEYGQGKAALRVSIKVVKHVRRKPGWIGKQGELKLVYAYGEREWNLMNVEAGALSDMAPDDVYNVRKTDGRPLLAAADEGDVETVKALLKRGANIYQRARGGETALMVAAGQGHIDVSKVLLKEGIDVDLVSADGLTALMIAASFHRTEMVKFLLNNGADPNCEGPLGCNPLLLALEKRPGHRTVSPDDLVLTVGALVNQGARVNVKDGRGCTPLWLALKCGDDDLVQLLLDKGADANMAAGPSGLTPLMEAVATGRPSTVKILLENGADVHVTKNGATALDMAKASRLRSNAKIELIQILKEAGAKE